MSTGVGQQRRIMALGVGALAIVAAGLLLLRVTPPAVAESGPVVANWQMNEGAGASTMNDSSGNNIDGSIGDDVTTGGGHYEFPAILNGPANEPVNLERLVQVPDNNNLEPGNRSLFVVEFQYRTTRSFGNVVQKGQNSGPGGYWKFELAEGRVTCLFQGPPIDEDGEPRRWPSTAVRTPADFNGDGDVDGEDALDNNEWHTVRCELDRDNDFFEHGVVRLYVDGDLKAINDLDEPLGVIDNGAPLTVGGKANCNQMNTTCDYFDGDVDYVTIERSGSVVDPPPTTTTTTSTTTTTTTTTVPVTTTTVASGGPTGDGIFGPADVDPDIQVERGDPSPLP